MANGRATPISSTSSSSAANQSSRRSLDRSKTMGRIASEAQPVPVAGPMEALWARLAVLVGKRVDEAVDKYASECLSTITAPQFDKWWARVAPRSQPAGASSSGGKRRRPLPTTGSPHMGILYLILNLIYLFFGFIYESTLNFFIFLILLLFFYILNITTT